jgi:hypothetical protein
MTVLLRRSRTRCLLIVIGPLVFGAIHFLLALGGSPAIAAEAGTPDYSSPPKTFLTFLKAIKADDVAAAKQCYLAPDGNWGRVVDAMVGKWIAARRFTRTARSKLPRKEYLKLEQDDCTWDDCTDAAIDRTIDRLRHVDLDMRENRGALWIAWQNEDGRESQPRFRYFGSRPVARFRRIGNAWKLDAEWECGFHRAADVFDPECWVYFSPEAPDKWERMATGIEQGKLRTADQIEQAARKERSDADARIETLRKKNPPEPIRARFFAAWNTNSRFTREYYAGRGALWGLCTWSRRLMEAETARANSQEERLAAAEAHVLRMRDARHTMAGRMAYGRVVARTLPSMDYYLADAELLLQRAQAKPSDPIFPLRHGLDRQAAADLTYQEYVNEAQLALWDFTRPKDDQHFPRVFPSLPDMCRWSRHLLTAEMEMANTPEKRRAAADAYRARTAEIETLKTEIGKATTPTDVADADLSFARAEGEVLIAQLHAGNEGKSPAVQAALRARVPTAKAAVDYAWNMRFITRLGFISLDDLYERSMRLKDALTAVAGTSAGKVAAASEHLTRMRKMQEHVKPLVDAGRLPTFEYWSTQYYIAEAELLLEKARAVK